MNEVPNRQKGKIMERNYEEIFQKVLDYEQALHEKNRKRIKIGLKCIWIVPLFFLALLFLTGSNKVIFLILWIVSLFALSIYLIVVEYMDYNLQEKIMELKGEEGNLKAVTPTDFDRAAQIIREDRSTNTDENIRYAAQLLETAGQEKDAVVITNEFHLWRGKFIARRNGFHATGYAAKTPLWWLRVQFHLREYFSCIKALAGH